MCQEEDGDSRLERSGLTDAYGHGGVTPGPFSQGSSLAQLCLFVSTKLVAVFPLVFPSSSTELCLLPGLHPDRTELCLLPGLHPDRTELCLLPGLHPDRTELCLV